MSSSLFHERNKGDFNSQTANNVLQLAYYSNVMYVTEVYSGPPMSVDFTIHCFLYLTSPI